MAISIFSTGRQIGQAVKSVQRLRQIVSVLARAGFSDVLERANLGNFLPGKWHRKRRKTRGNGTSVSSGITGDGSVAFDKAGIAGNTSDGNYGQFETDALLALEHQAKTIKDDLLGTTPQERLRKAFEELGPTFVKLGQVLSTRPDIVPEAYLEEFTKLQDDVQPMPFDRVKEAVESELKQPLSDLFGSFDEKPLAAASIGQVHGATLKSGERVVVKVQRPDISKTIETDVSILAFIANLLEKYVPESRILNPKVIVEEFFRTLTFELDYTLEANNMQRMADNLSLIPEIKIPRVYRAYSSHRVLTQERLEGIRVSDTERMRQSGIDRRKVVDIGARAFFRSILIDGLFHGDLHGGNLFVLPGDKLGLIDFGMVGRLSARAREQFANMLMSLVTEDYENLCYQYAELGSAPTNTDFDGFQREVRNTLAPMFGLALKDVNVGRVLIESTKIATKYQIKIPAEWMLVFKAIVTVEGMARTMDPDYDLMANSQYYVKELLHSQYNFQKISRDFIITARETAALVQSLPRQIRWMIKKFNANDFALEVKSKELTEVAHSIAQSGTRTGQSIMAAGLFVAAAISLNSSTDGTKVYDYPVTSIIFFVLALWFMLRSRL